MTKTIYAAIAGVLTICLLAILITFHWEKRVVGTWGMFESGNGSYMLRIRLNKDGTMNFRGGGEDYDGYWKTTNRFKRHIRFGPHQNSTVDSDSFAVSFKGNKIIMHHLVARSEVWELNRIPDHRLEY